MNVIDMMYGRKSIHHDLWWYFVATRQGAAGDSLQFQIDNWVTEGGDDVVTEAVDQIVIPIQV